MIVAPFADPAASADEATARAAERERVPATVDAPEIVFAFGDVLGELRDTLGYDANGRDAARIRRACAQVLSAYPALRDAVGDDGFALLVAAESMVDACRRGTAATLDDSAYEIVDGDYLTYRELSFDFAND